MWPRNRLLSEMPTIQPSRCPQQKSVNHTAFLGAYRATFFDTRPSICGVHLHSVRGMLAVARQTNIVPPKSNYGIVGCANRLLDDQR
jgi:hypothetical protein